MTQNLLFAHPEIQSSCHPDLTKQDQLQRRRSRYWSGHWAEVFAAVTLWFKGYRILARRKKTRVGELDLIAVRGNTIAFVEVKRRSSVMAARNAITPKQSKRIRQAAEVWLKGSPRYRGHHQRFDAVLVVPGRWPVHLAGAA
jgi:putative endonuclease